MTSNIIEHSNLSDKVYNILLDRIITQKIKPGGKLIEEDLAKNLGISRTPIREALNRLFRDDLIELIPRKGGYIRKLTARDVEEVYEIREVLENLAVRLAIPLIRDRALKRLEELVRKTEKLTGKDKMKSQVNIDSELHNSIITSCGNSRLQKMIKSLYNFIQAFRVLEAQQSQRSDQALQEHKMILEALSKRDVEQTTELMSRHIENTKNNILADFKFEG
jgi:DNA-binding GntR family transcriptional regulator